MSGDRFIMPAALVADVHRALGTRPPSSIDALAEVIERLAGQMLMGSTAKLQAMADGQAPPGADPIEVSERWLADRHIAWSCWAVSTVVAALANDAGLDTAVVLTRRTDAGSPPVDLHAALEIDDGSQRWVADAYHLCLPIPIGGGTASRPGMETALAGRAAGWDLQLRWCAWRADWLSYRRMGGPLDRGDVRALCRISTAFTGVDWAPRAQLRHPDGLATVVADSFEDIATTRTWRAATTGEHREPDEVTVAPTWHTAMHDLVATF